MVIRKRKMQTHIYAPRKKIMDQDRALLDRGHPVQYVYNELLDESASPLKSKFQSLEPHDKRQIYSKNSKRKRQMKANMTIIFPTSFIS